MHGNLPPARRRRIVRRDDSWTFVESEVLRELWPDVGAIKKRMPYRSELAVRAMAKRCGLIPDSNRHIWTGAEEKKLRQMAADGLTRQQIATELNLSISQVSAHMLNRRIHMPKRAPAPAKDPLAHAIRQRAFQLNMTISDLDRSLGRHQVFANATSNAGINPVHIHRAVKALGGKLAVVWDEE